jgi:beta-lactam-binding protein with PASTA domain
VAPSATATQVDDDALSAFPIVPCLVPSLRGTTLTQARAVLQAADCRVGTVRRRHTPPPHGYLHVMRQFPGPNARRAALTPVNVTLG